MQRHDMQQAVGGRQARMRQHAARVVRQTLVTQQHTLRIARAARGEQQQARPPRRDARARPVFGALGDIGGPQQTRRRQSAGFGAGRIGLIVQHPGQAHRGHAARRFRDRQARFERTRASPRRHRAQHGHDLRQRAFHRDRHIVARRDAGRTQPARRLPHAAAQIRIGQRFLGGHDGGTRRPAGLAPQARKRRHDRGIGNRHDYLPLSPCKASCGVNAA
ncbi:hypothetical protein D3C71_626610 [compost metagenome]